MFVTNLPTDYMTKEVSNFFTKSSFLDNICPPILHRSCTAPLIRVHVMKAKRKFNRHPNSDCVATFREQMGRQFAHLLTKRAQAEFWSTLTLQVICRPYPILDDEPCEDTFWWCPHFPHCGVHHGGHRTSELSLVSHNFTE